MQFHLQLTVIMVGVDGITFIIRDCLRSIVIGLPTGHNDWRNSKTKVIILFPGGNTQDLMPLISNFLCLTEWPGSSHHFIILFVVVPSSNMSFSKVDQSIYS